MMRKNYREAPSKTFIDSNSPLAPNLHALTEAHLNLQDQILRPSNPNSKGGNRRHSSSVITNPYDETVPADVTNRPSRLRNRSGKYSKSPTASIKRGKAEKLLKEHGSPPGIRVTAGGRIVPDALSPLNSPVVDNTTIFSQEHLNPAYTQLSSQSNTVPLNGWVVNIGNGNFCQVVDGHLRPVDQDNGVLRLYMPAPNLPVAPDLVSVAPQQFPPMLGGANIPFGNPTGYQRLTPTIETAQTIRSVREIQAMEQAHTQLQQDLKNLNRNEVLQRGSLTQAQRQDIVRRRVDLVNRIDESRRAFTNAKKLAEQQQKQDAQVRKPVQLETIPALPNVAPAQPVQMVDPQYFTAARPHQIEMFHPSSYMAPPQYFSDPSMFDPGLSDFLPNRAMDYGPQASQHAPTLQRRAGNVGLGIDYNNNHASQASTETLKPTNFANGMASMNLDGSAQQPRRSHAIEIKKPNESTVKSSHGLNPVSPTYCPWISSTDHSKDSTQQNGITSSVMLKSIDGATVDPTCRRDPHSMTEKSSNEGHPSESSATTGDFFPNESYKYSNKKAAEGKRDERINLSAWLPQGNEQHLAEKDTQSARLPTKFMFNEDRPASEQYSNSQSADRGKRCQDNLRGSDSSTDAAFENLAQSANSRYMSETDLKWAMSVNKSLQKQPSISKLLQKASERAATLATPSDQKTESYWEGYKTGIRQDVLSDSGDDSYRLGYRDGLMRSCKVSEDALTPRKRTNGISGDYTLAQPPDRSSSVPKTTSFPIFRATNSSPVPNPPANSLATTPVQSRSVRKEVSGRHLMIGGSPTVGSRLFGSDAVGARTLGTQTSRSLLEVNRSSSPLAERANSANQEDLKGQGYNSFATRMKMQRNEYEKQRCQKTSYSVAQTNESAHGHFRARYDGSADDDQQVTEAMRNMSSPTTPKSKDKGKAKSSGSPVKAKASAAMATMKQVAGIGLRKDDQQASKDKKKPKEATDPALMSAAEKKNWYDYWGRKFNQLKTEEQEEIERYKRENPAPR